VDSNWWKQNALDKLPFADAGRIQRNLVDLGELKEKQDELDRVRSLIQSIIDSLEKAIVRYEASFNETNPAVSRGMEEQAKSVIQKAGARISAAKKQIEMSQMGLDEKRLLTEKLQETLLNAKKKTGTD
jgi:CHASE3 domain sensor protein